MENRGLGKFLWIHVSKSCQAGRGCLDKYSAASQAGGWVNVCGGICRWGAALIQADLVSALETDVGSGGTSQTCQDSSRSCFLPFFPLHFLTQTLYKRRRTESNGTFSDTIVIISTSFPLRHESKPNDLLYNSPLAPAHLSSWKHCCRLARRVTESAWDTRYLCSKELLMWSDGWGSGSLRVVDTQLSLL